MAPNPNRRGAVTVEVDSSGQIMVKARAGLERELGKALRDIAEMAREIVRAAHDKTGRLRRSIQPYRGRSANVRMVGPTTIAGTVSAGSRLAPYARFVHEGTRPHMIRPRKPGGSLSFVGAGRYGRKTFTRKTMRLLTDAEWDDWGALVDSTSLTSPLRHEYNKAVRRSNRRIADINAGRRTHLRRRDLDVAIEETEQPYANRRVVVDEVHHPGYKGHRFLNEAAATVIGRRYGRGSVNLPRRPSSAIRPG